MKISDKSSKNNEKTLLIYRKKLKNDSLSCFSILKNEYQNLHKNYI
jgi:hypothetical protein